MPLHWPIFRMKRFKKAYLMQENYTLYTLIQLWIVCSALGHIKLGNELINFTKFMEEEKRINKFNEDLV